LGDASGAADLVAFLDVLGVAHQGDADVVLFEVQRDAVDVVRKLDQLARRDLVEAVDARDAVAGRQDHARLADLELPLVVLDLLADDVADLRGPDLHETNLPPKIMRPRGPSCRPGVQAASSRSRRR